MMTATIAKFKNKIKPLVTSPAKPRRTFRLVMPNQKPKPATELQTPFRIQNQFSGIKSVFLRVHNVMTAGRKAGINHKKFMGDPFTTGSFFGDGL